MYTGEGVTTRAAKKVLEKDWVVPPSRGAATRGKL